MRVDHDVHSLRKEHKEQIAQLLMLKAHHQTIIQSLDAHIATILSIGYGVNIANEEWNLDLERGVVSRADPGRN